MSEESIWQVVLIAAVVLGGMLLVVLAYFERRTHGEWRRRMLSRSGERNISRPSTDSPLEPILLRGKGPYTVQKVELRRGRYKLEYRFPAGELIPVTLIDPKDGDEQILVIKSGKGAIEFSVGADGTYMVKVEPDDLTTKTEIDIYPLGLPSRR